MDTNLESSPISYAAAAGQQNLFQLDLRTEFSSFDAPQFDVIQRLVRKNFPQDPGLIIQRLTNSLRGVIKIAATVAPETLTVHLPRRDFETGNIQNIAMKLKTWGHHREEKRDGTLITIVDGEMGDARSISFKEFDHEIGKYGEILVSTKPQRHYNSDILNGNKYCVIKLYDGAELPDRLSVRGTSFLIKYKGKKWFCRTCNETHQGPCEYLKKLYEARDRKKGEKIVTHIISDSGLRYTENVGLRATVSCMSGATTGQIVLAAQMDPDVRDHQVLVLAAGANDVKTSSCWSEKEAAVKIDISLKNLEVIADCYPEKTVFFVNTSPPCVDGTQLDCFATKYFDLRLRAIEKVKKNLNVVEPDQDPEQWIDNHPSPACTKELLLDLQTKIDYLVLDASMLTCKKPYQGVDSLWIFGCTGCRARGRFAPDGFCSTCCSTLADKNMNTKAFNEIVKLSREEFAGRKRPVSPNDSGDDGAPQKKAH